MTEKDKVLVNLITDMNTDMRNQDDHIEELDEMLASAEDTIRGLTGEKAQAAEAYHVSCVEKNETISKLQKIVDDTADQIQGLILYNYDRNLVGNMTNLTNKYINLKEQLEKVTDKLNEKVREYAGLMGTCHRLEKQTETAKAKASKLNAEKRKLMELMKEYQYKSKPHMLYSTVMKHYKAWLKKRGKK